MPSFFTRIRNTLKSVGRLFTARRRPGRAESVPVAPRRPGRVESVPVAPRRPARFNPSEIIEAAARMRRLATMRRTASARAAAPPPRASVVHAPKKRHNLARRITDRLHREATDDDFSRMSPEELNVMIAKLSARHTP